ncbi:hypothetical protein F4678DRAFT_486889 [Xylaria arbuscula]|nr:hypothetical protein F4678DRAFT_486889 [Xylaria arbuscula]
MYPFTKHLVFYEKLRTNENEPSQSLPSVNTGRRRRHLYYSINAITLSASFVFFVLGSLMLYMAHLRESGRPSDWSMRGFESIPRRDIKFVGSFETTTPYRGVPGPELDAAWARFTTSHWVDGSAVVLSIEPEDIAFAKKDKEEEWYNSTVQLGDENGGGMMGTLEMFHQLHCLDMVRKFTYYKYPYYKDTGGVFNRPIEAQMFHIDHCLEILRQVVMCNGDTGLITFHWVEENPVAYPDFNTWHSCRDPEAILASAKAREAPMRRQVTKTQGIVEMPTPP